MLKVIKAVSLKEIDEVCKLFMEYSASLDFDLDFQGFRDEIETLPGKYAPPDGKLYLALCKNKPAGCIAVRKIDDEYCEMKRLYVRPEFRGLKIGKALTEIIIHEAKKIGYKYMRLDTVLSMSSARKIYEEFGFKIIAPYYHNPVEGAVYMELDLQKGKDVDINIQDFLECSILFNPWKHHKNYIYRQTNSLASRKDRGLAGLKKNLLKTGGSQMDLYIGELNVPEIFQNVSAVLLKQKIEDKSSFVKWLKKSGKDYRNIKLTDKSQWTLRLSGKDEKFVHIHPARYSVNTIRVRAVTLQTAVAAIYLSKLKNASAMDISIINEARKRFLGEPPVKTIYKNSGLGKIILLLT